MSSDLATLTLAEMRAGLVARRFSSVELTTALLDRAEKASALNAFITLSRERTLAEAQECDARLARGEGGVLLGVPIAIKDMILTRGERTTAASKMLADFVAPYDATVVAKLREAGAVIFGKTNLDEFAMGSSNETSFFGAVRNPWSLDHVPGGSSGGSAAAVAARLAPAALGTDTGGSIRQPASFCNIVGLKPTYGRVSRYGAIAYASSLDQIGPFAANVADCAAVYEVIAGVDPLDSTSVDAPRPDLAALAASDLRGLRIGIPREYFIKGLRPEVESLVRSAVTVLEGRGATVVEISLPHTELAVAVYYILAPAEASSNLARYDGVRFGHRAEGVTDLKDLYCRSRSEGFSAEVQRRILVGTYVLSAGYFDAYYVKAQRVRALIARDFATAFAHECDVIACPTAPTPPFRLAEKVEDPLAMYLNDVFTIPVNLAGLPALSIPCGFVGDLPVGLQLIGKPWNEDTLLKVGQVYESATDWHTRIPALSPESSAHRHE
jgi:aspartyl-tRNA(Asn)/glutamyl-tRNA(Gln) amidotransferase subunit A